MIRKRRKFGKILISLLLVISMVSMMTMTSFAAKQAKATSVVRFRTAVVNQMNLGENSSAEVQRGAEALPVYEGMRLNKGDIVRTKGDAVLYILVDQDKIIRLDKDTEAELTETLLGIKVKMTLIKGSMFFNVVEKLPDDETLQFVYGNITISIRGTSAEIACDENGGFVMNLADGEVSAEVTSGQGDAEKVQSYDIKPGTKFECACGNEEKGTKPVIKTGSLILSQLSPSMLAELKKDPQLAERVVSSTPVSTGPGGAVYAAVTEAVSLEKIVDEAYDSSVKSGNMTLAPSKEIAQAAAANQGKTVPGTGTSSGSSDDGGNSTPEPVKVTCPGCGKQVTEAELKASHAQLACGHYACQSGDHTQLACGHYACQEGTHEELLPCGKHYKCQVAESEWSKHEKLACGHYGCEEGDHTQLACGHYACQIPAAELELHKRIDQEVTDYYCKHTDIYKICPGCGEVIRYYIVEGQIIAEEGHRPLDCGNHYECEVDPEERMRHSDNKKCECGHYACEEEHRLLACGHSHICEVDEEDIWKHDETLKCGTPWCVIHQRGEWYQNLMRGLYDRLPVFRYNRETGQCDIDACLCQCGNTESVKCPICGEILWAGNLVQNGHCEYDAEGQCFKCPNRSSKSFTEVRAAFRTRYGWTDEKIDEILAYFEIRTSLHQLQSLESKQPEASVPDTAASSEGTEQSMEESAGASEEETAAPVEETSPAIEETTAPEEETVVPAEETAESTEETAAAQQEEQQTEEQTTAEQETTELPAGNMELPAAQVPKQVKEEIIP